ncbi:Nucleolar complex protein 2 [Botrytis cinerea]
MAKSTKKSTRKFEKNHLKDTLEKRKDGAKYKQRQQMKAKRTARNAKDAEFLGGKEDGEEGSKPKPSAKEDAFGKMSVDDFFQGGFDVPAKLEKKSKAKKGAEKLGKRKRTEPEEEEEEEEESSDDSIGEAPVMSDSEDGDDNDDEGMTGMSKSAMDALAEKDPEFYKYLKENDPEALDFEDDADFAEVDELSGEEDEQPKKKKQKKSKKAKKEEVVEVEEEEEEEQEEAEEEDASEVTKAMVTKWNKAMSEQKSLRAMRQVVLAFRAAAHVNEDDGKEYKYSITNPEVYHELLLAALKQVPEVLNHHLPVKESAAGKVRVSTDSKKFKTLSPLLRSHITSVQHLLASLSDASTLKLTLSSVIPLLPYLLSFKKVLKNVVKTVVDIWSDASSTEATRITAFLVIRRLAIIGDAGLREAVMKTVYQGLLKGSRNTTIHTIQGINLMKNSAAELWELIKVLDIQPVLHLFESYKQVYNWQYVHSLDFWSTVLAEHCNSLKEAETGKESQLRPLIYPTVQVTLGAMRLIPTSTYFPLRFHLIRSLLRLSRATGTYIPLASVLLEVLNSAEMKKPPKPSTSKFFDFTSNFKAQKSYLRTRVYQDGIGEQVAELLAEFFVLWSTSIALPELTLPVVVMLKRWLKDASNKSSGNKNSKVTSMFVLLIQKLEANSKWIEGKRAKVEFAPNDRAGVDGFLKGFEWEKTPLGAFVVGQRKQREEKAKMLEEGRREEDRKRKLEREQEKEMGGSDDDSEVDEEEDSEAGFDDEE